MRILIIRHGDPNYKDDCLTEKGRKEAFFLSERLKDEKIDYIYSSPLGRAYETCMYTAKAKQMEKDVTVLPWLREFAYNVGEVEERGTPLVWDMLPSYWANKAEMYDKEAWIQQDVFQKANIEEYYNQVKDGVYSVLEKHGYVREGGFYKAVKPNKDTIAFFCHFGLEMILLSVIFGVSPIPLLHHFAAAPTSVTTLYTEERREGIALFRCTAFGDTGHLYAKGELPSFSARFRETETCSERKDP